MGFETFLYHNVTTKLESFPKTKRVLSALFGVFYKNTILNKKYRLRKSIMRVQCAINKKEMSTTTIDGTFAWSNQDGFQLPYDPQNGTGFFPKSISSIKSTSATKITTRNSHIYDQEMLDAISKISTHKIKTIIDVGANAGSITLGFVKEYPDAHIISYEPVQQTFTILNAVIRKNKLDNVSAHQLAVGQMSGTLYMTTNLNTGNHFINLPKKIPNNVARVRVVTLDEEMKKQKCTPDIIKIDVEGAEWQVLMGARKTIEQHKPILILELFDPWLARNNTNAQQIAAYLTTLGYRYYCIDTQRKSSSSLVNDLRDNTNFLFYV